MAFIDLLILALIVFGGLRGFFRGLAGSIGGVAGLLVGIVACRLFGSTVASALAATFPETEYYVTTISAYIIVFLIFYFGIKLIAMLLKETLRALNLGGFDRAGGALFGALKYLLMLSLVLNALYAIEPDASLFHSSGLMEGRVFALVMRMAPWAWGVDFFPNTVG